MEKKNGITEGVIWKQLLIFFVPILIGAFFQQLYNTIDTVVVGRFAGKEALSSVGGSSAVIVGLVVGFFTGLTSGCSVLISQYYGAKDEKRLDTALHTSYLFSVVGGLIFGAFGILATPLLFHWMGTPAELYRSSLTYIRIYFAGLVFVFVYNMGSAVMRATGDSKRPLYYLMICSVINIILDLLFVCAFRWSVMGVALATLISQGVSAVMVTLAMIRQADLRLNLKKLRIDFRMLGGMLRIGLPAGLQSSMYSISNMIVQSHVNTFGVDSVAAWAAYGKVDSIFWMINNAFGLSITTFAGQNFGAGKPDRIRKGLRINIAAELVVAVALSILVHFFGPLLLGLFTTDASVIAIGMVMLHILSPAYFTFVFVEQLSGTLRAEGCVAVPTMITVCGVCLFRIIWLSFIIPGKVIQEVMYCYPITWALSMIGMSIYYLYKQPRLLSTMKGNENQ